jgi:hypothetical protein
MNKQFEPFLFTIYLGINLCLTFPYSLSSIGMFYPAPVGYWPMTGQTGGTDLSGNRNHATLHGVTFTDGPTGEAKGATQFLGRSTSYTSVVNSPFMKVGQSQ